MENHFTIFSRSHAGSQIIKKRNVESVMTVYIQNGQDIKKKIRF